MIRNENTIARLQDLLQTKSPVLHSVSNKADVSYISRNHLTNTIDKCLRDYGNPAWRKTEWRNCGSQISRFALGFKKTGSKNDAISVMRLFAGGKLRQIVAINGRKERSKKEALFLSSPPTLSLLNRPFTSIKLEPQNLGIANAVCSSLPTSI